MTIKLLTERHLEFVSLKGGYTGSYESTFVKMPHCWKSHVTVKMPVYLYASFVLYLAFVHAPCKMLQHLAYGNTMSTLDEQIKTCSRTGNMVLGTDLLVVKLHCLRL